MIILFLALSIVLATTRNILSKEISGYSFGEKRFFLSQSIIFLTGSLILLFGIKTNLRAVSSLTILYVLIYGILLITAQYCYTTALKKGNVGICSTIYSLGFIFPTLSGAVFWDETLTVFNIIGVLLVIPVIILTGLKPNGDKHVDSKNGYIIPLTAAMLASGGLGIMQKVQQNSICAEQKDVFLTCAFMLAGIVSFIFYIFSMHANKSAIQRKKIISAGGIGMAFALSNLLNTILAGKLDSAVFFPVLNVGTIIFSLLLGMVLYKEKFTRKDTAALSLGIISILLITLL